MDSIPIPEEDVVPIEEIAPDIAGLRLLMVNVFAVARSAQEWMLVDTGLPHSATRIQTWARKHFREGLRPKLILLTHGHFDHAGSVEELAQEWDVPVFVHPQERQYVTGESAYAPPDPSVGGGLMSLLSKMYPRGPFNVGARAQTLPPDGVIPGFPEWRWIHTPGHTDGHVSLFRERDRLLLAGDAFCTTRQESFLAVATQHPELHGPPAYFTTDWDAARDSVQRLAALRPAMVTPGHGLPLKGSDVAEKLISLAARFDEVARPAQGRYVHEPAA